MNQNNVYIGMRYIPKYLGVYSNTAEYEPLSLVKETEDASIIYISVLPVPAGTPLSNRTYWQAYTAGGDTTELEQEIAALTTQVNNQTTSITALDTRVTANANEISTLDSMVETNTDDINALNTKVDSLQNTTFISLNVQLNQSTAKAPYYGNLPATLSHDNIISSNKLFSSNREFFTANPYCSNAVFINQYTGIVFGTIAVNQTLTENNEITFTIPSAWEPITNCILRLLFGPNAQSSAYGIEIPQRITGASKVPLVKIGTDETLSTVIDIDASNPQNITVVGLGSIFPQLSTYKYPTRLRQYGPGIGSQGYSLITSSTTGNTPYELSSGDEYTFAGLGNLTEAIGYFTIEFHTQPNATSPKFNVWIPLRAY